MATRVSIIIPTYNRGRYVTKAIESVFKQNYKDCEIIVVDDGSNDGTAKILKPIIPRIRYIRQPNSGVSAARNAGIRESQGEWIAFLDSDDEWMEGYLEAQLESVSRFPDAVAHIMNSISITPERATPLVHFEAIGLNFRSGPQMVCRRPFRIIVSRAHWFLQPLIVRRDVLIKAGLFNPALSIAEDMDLVARIALRGAFTFNREALVAICRRDEEIASLSSQYMNRGIYSRKSFVKVFSNLMNFPELTFRERRAVAKALNEKLRALGNIYLANGNPKMARHYYLKAMSVYPEIVALVKCVGSYLPREAASLLVRKNNIVPGDEGEPL